MAKTIVIGLDGAGLHLLEPWIDDGTLPTLSKLMDGGAWQKLKSTYPPVTCPAWRCYSTGVNPGKLGVFWWEEFERDSNSLTVPDSESFRAKSIWDYLGNSDFTSATINLPTTHPPEKLNGWMVSGIGFDEDYTYPANLQEELEESIEYENDIDFPRHKLAEDPKYVRQVNEIVDRRFEAAEYLREEYDPDFLHLTVFVTNAVQHYSWGGKATRLMWENVDENINELVSEDDNVIIMSDHGSNEIQTIFNINSWLEENGYLKTKKSSSDVIYSLGFNKQDLIKHAETLGIRNILSKITPEAVVDKLPESQGGVGRELKEDKIIWEETEAVASGQGPIYVLDKDGEVKDEIIEDLRGLKSPGGNPVFNNVFDASEVYQGPYADEGPDIVIDQADGVHIPDVVGSPETFVSPEDWKWESENHRDGLFIAHGPDVVSSGKLEAQPSIYDIAPTILHWYGRPIPEKMDGEVISEIFKESSGVGGRSITYNDEPIEKEQQEANKEESEEMVDRLRDLGYLSD